MLEIQKFILAHKDWKELLSKEPYYLKIAEWDSPKLYGFHYNQIKSDLSLEICREARGLILDENYKIAAYPFYKFFNCEESYAADIDWESSYSTLKIDGSLIIVFYNEGWQVATSSGRKAATVKNDYYYPNFKMLFDKAAENSGLDWDRLDPRYTYCFELVSPYNKVVINYNEPKLYHIFSRNNNSLEEEEVDIGIEKPRRFQFNSKQDYKNLIKEAEEKNIEGVVIQDKYGNRVKMKTQSYLEKSYLKNNGVWSEKRIINAILSGESSEVLSYFPEYNEAFSDVSAKMALVYSGFCLREVIIKGMYVHMSRQDFAAEICHYEPYVRSIFFQFYDGKTFEEICSKWTAREWLRAIYGEEDKNGLCDSAAK